MLKLSPFLCNNIISAMRHWDGAILLSSILLNISLRGRATVSDKSLWIPLSVLPGSGALPIFKFFKIFNVFLIRICRTHIIFGRDH